MDEPRKNAYRHLLYMAMLNIAELCPQVIPRTESSTLDLPSCRQAYDQSRIAGALAGWLHNLANHAAHDFQDFSEEEFWRTHEWYCQQIGGDVLPQYPQHFEQRLNHDQL